MGPQFMCQFEQDRHITALAAFALGNQNHRFIQKEIFDLDVDKLRDTGTSLKERLNQEPALAFVPIGPVNQALLFVTRQALDSALAVVLSK